MTTARPGSDTEPCPVHGTPHAQTEAAVEPLAVEPLAVDEAPAPSLLARPWSLGTRIQLAIAILANVLPLVGVVAWGWDLGDLMVLYWAETAAIGVVSLARLGATTGKAALVAVPFFLVHGGFFMLVHGIFVAVLFIPDGAPGLLQRLPGLALPLLGLAVGHILAFVQARHALPNDGTKAGPTAVMGAFYGRVMVMHLTIIGGGFLTVLLGSPAWALVLLVGLKTAIDVAFIVGASWVERFQPGRSRA